MFEFKLGFLVFGLGGDPGGGWFERRFWRFFDEAYSATIWMGERIASGRNVPERLLVFDLRYRS